MSGPDGEPRPTGLHTTETRRHPVVPQALRRHRLPRFWLALTLGSVLLGLGLVYWWERQLPRRIEAAAAAGRLEDCLRYSEQLAAVSWLPGRSPLQQGRCRRDRATQLWRQEEWARALRLQRQLIHSAAGTPQDRARLNDWEEELRRTAAARYQAGDLNGALAALAPMGEAHRSDGQALGDDLRQNWERNRLQLERAGRLARQSRWWEALDALNRIDHPWWQQRSLALRKKVQAGLTHLTGKDQEQHSHGDLPHTVPPQQLDALVQRRIAAGMGDWQAFEESCRELGGKVVEAGPESACQR